MKLKNVVVGSKVEAKHDTKHDTKSFKKGDLVKVMDKEDDNYRGEMTLNIMDSDGDTFWVNHKDFRRPRPKKLDQSIFDGAHEMWRFASVDEDGAGFRFAERPELTDCFWGNVNCSRFDRLSQSGTYDASNWQNSLIARESKELTGSELCKAMLARGDKYVMCLISNNSEMNAKADNCTHVVRSFNESDCHFQAKYNRWQYAIPINNQGEPLTAKDVGL